MTFKIRIAEFNIEIHSMYERVYSMCRDYLTDEEHTDLVIRITPEDLEAERSRAEHKASDSYLETLAVYRKIAAELVDHDTFLMHGSVVAVDDEAYMITAASGMGKTTRTNMWLKCIANSYVVNGDKPLLKIKGDQVYACGTPWKGKENEGINAIVPLKAIFFLERADFNCVTEIRFSDAFIKLLQQTFRPEAAGKMEKTLHLLAELNGKVRFYRFQSNLDEEAVRMAYELGAGDVYDI